MVFKLVPLIGGVFGYLVSLMVFISALVYMRNVEFMLEGMLASFVLAFVTFVVTDHRDFRII